MPKFKNVKRSHRNKRARISTDSRPAAVDAALQAAADALQALDAKPPVAALQALADALRAPEAPRVNMLQDSRLPFVGLLPASSLVSAQGMALMKAHEPLPAKSEAPSLALATLNAYLAELTP